MTNKEKFKEVFGFVPTSSGKYAVCPEDFDCENVPTCGDCPFGLKWWEREYKECFRLKVEGKILRRDEIIERIRQTNI